MGKRGMLALGGNRREHADDEADEAPLTQTEEEFTGVIARHHQRLTQLAYTLCGDREQAEDAVIEAYARLWARYQRGDVEHVTPRLWRAVIHEIERTARWRLPTPHPRRRSGSTVARPISDVTDDEVWNGFMQLPFASRSAIVLYSLEGLSESDTAVLLDVSVGTVRERAARGIDQLNRVLEEPMHRG